MRTTFTGKSVLIVVLVSVFAILALSCTRNQTTDKTEEWKFAIEEIQGSVQHAYAEKFKKLIEDGSGGQVKVTIYPYGSLGTSDQLTELVQNNALQFAMASPGHLGKLIPEVQVFLLHFVFSQDEKMNFKLLNDEGLLDLLRNSYSAKGFHLLDLFQEGWQVWTANKKLLTPDDFKGLKIRVMTSPLLVKAYEAYGANPTPMSYSEVYSALQLNMIDAQVNPLFAVEEMSFYEVSNVITMAKHAPFVASLVTSSKFFKQLSPQKKEWVNSAIEDSNSYILEHQLKLNNERLEKMLSSSNDLEIVELNTDQRLAFQKLSTPVRKQFVKLAGSNGEKILKIIENKMLTSEMNAKVGDAATTNK